MEYDTKVHIAQQVENFMNSFAAGDINALNRTLSNLEELIKDNGFKEKINAANDTKTKEVKDILTKAKDGIKEITSSDDTDTLFIDIDEIRNDLNKVLGELETDYWTSIRKYVLEALNEL